MWQPEFSTEETLSMIASRFGDVNAVLSAELRSAGNVKETVSCVRGRPITRTFDLDNAVCYSPRLRYMVSLRSSIQPYHCEGEAAALISRWTFPHTASRD